MVEADRASEASPESTEPFAPKDICEQRYRIVRRLKAGGYGVVYEAEHLFTGGRVALKALYNRAGDHPERMRLEARALAEIRHPNVVQVTDGGVTPNGVVWFTMELLFGRTLREEIYSVGALGVERALRFGREIADGVAAAHALRVIHRDLKPENVFVVQPGDTVRVLDFGTSKFRDSALKTTDRFRILGTHAYMSPERLLANVVDHRADIFALGHILYEMLSGMHCLSEGPGPLDFPPRYELGMRQIYAPPPPLRERAPDVPDYVAGIVHRSLAKERAQRQQSMSELASELERARSRYLREIGASELDRPNQARFGFSSAPPSPGSAAEGVAASGGSSSTLDAPVVERTLPIAPIAPGALSAPASNAPSEVRSVAPGEPPAPSEIPRATSRVALASFEAEAIDGAARFVSRNPSLPLLDGLRFVLSLERDSANWLGRVQYALLAVAQAPGSSVQSLRYTIAAAHRTSREAIEATLEPWVQVTAQTARQAGADLGYEESHSRVLVGAARLIEPELRFENTLEALSAVAHAPRIRHDLCLMSLVAIARTDASTHSKPRAALIALLLGNPAEQAAAEDTLLFFISACMRKEERLPFGSAVERRPASKANFSKRQPPSQTLQREPSSPSTPVAMSTPVEAERARRRHRNEPQGSTTEASERVKLVPALVLAAMIAIIVLAFGVVMRSRRATANASAPAASAVVASSAVASPGPALSPQAMPSASPAPSVSPPVQSVATTGSIAPQTSATSNTTGPTPTPHLSKEAVPAKESDGPQRESARKTTKPVTHRPPDVGPDGLPRGPIF